MISDRAQYINLSTRKRNGSFVDTPVWFAQARETNNYYIFSLKKAGKVKRIRNFTAVKIATCNYRGKLNSKWLAATAKLIEDSEEITIAYRFLRNKYGLTFRIGDVFSWIVGNYHRRQIIKVCITKNAFTKSSVFESTSQ